MYFSPLFFLCTHKNRRAHTGQRQGTCRPARTQVMYLPCRIPEIYLLPLIHTHTYLPLTSACASAPIPLSPLSLPAKQPTQFHIPILHNSAAGWPWSSEDRSETDRPGEGAAIHLMSACQPGQTSLGKQSIARESCKHHQPEWHDLSNYLSSLDCGPSPCWEVGCKLMALHTNAQKQTLGLPTATWHHHLFHDIYFWQSVACLLCMLFLFLTLSYFKVATL